MYTGTNQGQDMSARPPTSHLPALGTHEREEVGHQLQATLVELIDLALVGKQRGHVSRARSQHCCVSPEATPTDGVDCPLGSTAQVLRVGTFSAHRLGGRDFRWRGRDDKQPESHASN